MSLSYQFFGLCPELKYEPTAALTKAIVVASDGLGNQNWLKNRLLRQVEQGFSSFFAKLLVYLMIFQSGVRQRWL